MRQAKPGKGGADAVVEDGIGRPVGTLRVISPARPRLVASRKRVLRGHGRPWLRSVDSECAGRVIEPRKDFVAEADAVDIAEGNTGALSRMASDLAPRHAGVVEQGTYTGVRQEPGMSSCLLETRYRRAKETKRGGMGVWKSEPFIVPVKPRNQLEGTRWREGAAESWNRWRER